MKLKLLHWRVLSTIDLAAFFTSPVSWRIFVCGQGNVLTSNEASERPAFLTRLPSDINGSCSSSRVRIYAPTVVLFTSSYQVKTALCYWPTDWLTLLLLGRLTDWLGDWTSHWLTDWVAKSLTDWLVGSLTDWLAEPVTDRLIVRPTD